MNITLDTLKKIEEVNLLNQNDLNKLFAVVKAQNTSIDEALKSEIEEITKKYNEAKEKAAEKVLTKTIFDTMKFLGIKSKEKKEKVKKVLEKEIISEQVNYTYQENNDPEY